MSETHLIAALAPLWPGVETDAPFGGTTVLGHTLLRLARVGGLNKIVVIHGPETDAPAHLPDDPGLREKLVVHRAPGGLADPMTPARVAARKFTPRAWRGGLGGATIWDEVLAPGAMIEALDSVGAGAGLIVGADWPLVDPGLCTGLIERRRSEPEQLKLVFNQAPPGLSGCVVERSLLVDLGESGAMIGSLLDYQPRVPQGDPIGKAPCVQIESSVRDASVRVTHDGGRYAQALGELAGRMDPDALLGMDASSVVDQLSGLDSAGDGKGRDGAGEAWPNELTLELTTQRIARGPLAPGADDMGVTRSPLSVDAASNVFRQIATHPDVIVTLGGVGDPLLHPDWESIVLAAHEAGVYGLHLRTDLIVDEAVLERLISLPIDVVSVNLNADTPETYRAVMGVDEHARVIKNIEWLLNNRNRVGGVGLPWVAPRFAKTGANVAELEDFFDRWTFYAGHAVVESPSTGCGAVEDRSVMPMAPPVRSACRQLRRRLTVHSDGAVALCDQDWRGRGCVGVSDDLEAAWGAARGVYAKHTAGDFASTEPCAACNEWHRP